MKRKLGEVLIASGAVTQEDIDSALNDQSAGEAARLGDLLVSVGKITPMQLARALSEQHRIPYVDLPPISADVLALVNPEFQRVHRLVPFRKSGDKLFLAMADPSNIDAVKEIRDATGCNVTVFVSPGDEIEAVHLREFGPADGGGGGYAQEESQMAPPEEQAPPPTDTFEDLFGDVTVDPPEAKAQPAEVFKFPPPSSKSGVSFDVDANFDEPQVTTTDDDFNASVTVEEDGSSTEMSFDSDPAMDFGSVSPAAPVLPAPAPVAKKAPPPPQQKVQSPPPQQARPAAPAQTQTPAAPMKGAAAPPAPAAAKANMPSWLSSEVESAKKRPSGIHAVPPPPSIPIQSSTSGVNAVAQVVAALKPNEWTGKLDDYPPSRVMLAAVKAMMKKGFLSEEDILEFLTKK